jgi:sugar/nucleoside kinase (ribokinase family)
MVAHDLYCIGQPLLDIQVQVSEAALAALESYPKGARSLVTAEALEEALASPSVAGAARTLSAGGAAANTTFGFVSMGGAAALTGKVGVDEHAAVTLADMQAQGVTVLGGGGGGAGDTGVCLSLATPDAERTMLTSLGVSGELTKSDIDWDALRGARCLLVELYLWAVPTAAEAAEAAIEAAASSGALVALTLADAGMVTLHRSAVLGLLEHVDILLGNEAEALALFGLPTTRECVEEAAKTCGRVVVTLGAEGAMVAEAGGPAVLVPAVDGVTAVDTTGCGDIFAAGVLHGVLCREGTLVDAAEVGAAAAAYVASRLGPRLLQDEAELLGRGPPPASRL